MYDRTRIAVCRWGFLLLCVVPTLLTCSFIVWHWLTLRSPAAKAEWERELSQRLGVAVSIESVSYPRPNVAELLKIGFADVETAQLLAECPRAEIQPQDGGWHVTLTEPMIRRDALAALAERLHERLLASGETTAPIRLDAAHATLEHETRADSLVDLAATLESTNHGPVCTIRASLPQSEPLSLRMVRNRQVSPPATSIEWHCTAPLPARLLGVFMGDVHWLGEDATIAGAGQFTIAKWGTSGDASCEIAGIDLTTAISERFPHVLSGQAKLTLRRATIEDGRLTNADGALVVDGGGRIGRSLLEAAREYLQLTCELPDDGSESLHYRRLAIGFDLIGDRLRLKSVGREQTSGVLLASDTGPLVSAPTDHEAPAVELARTLLPESQVQVPAAAQTASLIGRLALPSAQPPLSARRSAHTPTRLTSPPRSSDPIRERSLR